MFRKYNFSSKVALQESYERNINKIIYSTMTCIKNTIIITTLNVMILSIMKLSITAQGMTLSIMALHTKRSYAECHK
jgi:hypothetical protein